MEIAGKAWKLVMFRCDKLMITSGQKETPGMEKGSWTPAKNFVKLNHNSCS